MPCGDCVRVCSEIQSMDALIPKYQINEVWNTIHDPKKTVVVQIVPAVRVALGEYFGHQPETTTKHCGQLKAYGLMDR